MTTRTLLLVEAFDGAIRIVAEYDDVTNVVSTIECRNSRNIAFSWATTEQGRQVLSARTDRRAPTRSLSLVEHNGRLTLPLWTGGDMPPTGRT